MRRSSILCLGLTLLFAACRPALRTDGGRGLLSIGAVAPDVTGTARDGSSTKLSAARGHAAVVYFYPKDATPGCTKEACAFRDAFTKYEERRVTIFGVSRDSEESHKKFRANHSLPFPLVADEDGSVASAYGVSSTLGMTSRVTFLVGPDGTIVRIWPDVDPGIHADEVLAAAQAVQAAPAGETKAMP